MTKTKPRKQSKDKRIIKEQAKALNRLYKADQSQHFGTSMQGEYREDAFRPSTSEDFLQLFETYGHVFACVDAIARNAAGIPLKVFHLKSLSATKDRMGEEITDGPWWSLLNTPNKFTSGSGLIYSLIAFQQLTGTAYLEKVGQPDLLIELWPLRPDWVKIKPDAKDLIGGYEYDVDGLIIKYTAEEVVRFKSWHPRSELYGLSTISPTQNSIITDMYCAKYTKQFFKQGGHLNWYIKIKEELGDVAFKRLEQQLKTKFAGLENAHSPAIIDADGELKELGGSPDRNTLLPQKTLSRQEVGETFGVPPVMLGYLDTSTYNNAKEQERIFWEQKEMPLIRELVDTLNRAIFWPNDMEVKPDYTGVSVLQTNYNEKAPAGKTLVDGKIMTPNEVRKNLFGLEPINGGDEFPEAPSPFGFGGGEQKSELPTMVKILEVLVKGGQGSGNFGHAGRPGEVGGSNGDVRTWAGPLRLATDNAGPKLIRGDGGLSEAYALSMKRGDQLIVGDKITIAGNDGYKVQTVSDAENNLPDVYFLLEDELKFLKGGQGSGYHEHYPRPGGGSHPRLTEEKIKEIEKDLFGGNDLDAFDKLRAHGLTADEAKQYVREAKGCADTSGLINRIKPKKPKAQREAIVKAMAEHRNAQVARAYTDIEKVCVEGYKGMGQAVLGVIGKVEKVVAFIKKDVVAEAIASLDAPTMAMAKELLKVERSKLKPIIEAEFKRAKKSEPDEKTLNELDRKVGTHLERMVDESMTSISKTNKERVENKLTGLLESDATTETIRKEFEDLFEGTEREGAGCARMVARTEALKFTETARFNSLTEMGFGEKEWFHSGHEDARPDHLAADGEVVPMNKKFSTNLLYPGDPDGDASDVVNCFTGDALLDSPSGIDKVFSSWFNGQLITVKFSDGQSLTGTPNHPILTGKGWVALGKLYEGDCIIGTEYGKGMGFRQSDIENMIPSFEKFYNSVSSSTIHMRNTELSVNFHGDIPDGDVDIIKVDRLLLDEFYSRSIQECTELIFTKADLGEANLFADSLKNFRFYKKGSGLIPQDPIGLGNVSLPLSKSHFSIPQENGFPDISSLDIIPGKYPIDDFTRCSVLNGDTLLRHTAKILSDDFRGLCIKTVMSTHKLPPDRVKVYTLQAPSKIYIINGVVCHNCGCTFAEYVAAAAEEA